MPFRYLEDIATADVAFEAWGSSVEEMFISAADATMNVMVADLSTISMRDRRKLEVTADELDMLLFQLLQEIIFFKDADKLLLRVESVTILEREGSFVLTGEAYGEELDPETHELVVDVKAVTLHRFLVRETERGWEATVILDI